MGDIKDTLALHGLSLTAFARLLDTTRRAVQYWDKGKNTPPTAVMIVLQALATGALSRERIQKLGQMPLRPILLKSSGGGKVSLTHAEVMEQAHRHARKLIEGSVADVCHDEEEIESVPPAKRS